MTNTPYGKNEKRKILVFNNRKKLIGIFSSLLDTAKTLKTNKVGIYNACAGKSVAYLNYYYRYLFDDIEITTDDIGLLTIQEYDSLCNVQRPVYRTATMKKGDIIKNPQL